MINLSFLSLRHGLVHLLIAYVMLWMPGLSVAAVLFSCSATMTSMTFSDVDLANNDGLSSSANFTYTCKNTGVALTRNAQVCFSIGDGSQGAGNYTPRRMVDGSGNVLQFQLFHPDNSTIWGTQGGTQIPTPVRIVLEGVIKGETRTGTFKMHGKIVSAQAPPVPGNFQNNFSGGHTKISVKAAPTTSSFPADCGNADDGSFPFIVTAVIVKSCNVDASNMNFGSVPQPVLATNIDAQSNINVNCTRSTPYTIALTPSNNSSTGAGQMSPVGGLLGNLDKVPYQLYRAAPSTGQQWGDQIDINTKAGTGTGMSQSYPVYGRVPSANFAADSYIDIVTVRVNY
ncbi:spore coat U domain-containing protein [Alcaligenaceae bacterium CGII-47]|nr:spore coat U domain-containing protein [Alcaligenaceae bacterium CGII-47]